MILILSPIPQILFYKKRDMLLVRVQTKIILLCQGQFLIGE